MAYRLVDSTNLETVAAHVRSCIGADGKSECVAKIVGQLGEVPDGCMEEPLYAMSWAMAKLRSSEVPSHRELFKTIPVEDMRCLHDAMVTTLSGKNIPQELGSAGGNFPAALRALVLSSMYWIEEIAFQEKAIADEGLFPRLVAGMAAHVESKRCLGAEALSFFASLLHDSATVALQHRQQDPAIRNPLHFLVYSGAFSLLLSCLQLYPNDDELTSCFHDLIEKLRSAASVLRDLFQAGSQVRQELAEALARVPRSSKACPLLKQLSDNVNGVRPPAASQEGGRQGTKLSKLCRTCGREDRGLAVKFMACSKCVMTFYCSRECQVANWKEHKKICNRVGSTSQTRANSALLFDLVQRQYVEIFKSLRALHVERGGTLRLQQMAVCADTVKQTFYVVAIEDFMHGRGLPAHVSASNLPKLRPAVEEIVSILQPGMMLCLDLPSSGGSVAVQRLLLQNTARENLFDDAFLTDRALHQSVVERSWPGLGRLL